MMYDVQTLVPASSQPISRDDARAWLRMGSDVDLIVLDWMIAAATARYEAKAGRALMIRTVRERFWSLPVCRLDAWPLNLTPAFRPVDTLIGALVVSASGALIPAREDQVTAGPGVFRVATPTVGVELTYTAGVATVTQLTELDRMSVLRELSVLYADRDSIDQLKPGDFAPRTAMTGPRL